MSRARGWIWLAVTTLVLVGVTSWVLAPAITGIDKAAGGATGGSGARPSAGPLAAAIPTKAQLMTPGAPRFGLSAPQVPFSRGEINRIATAAGQQPTLLQYFVKFRQSFRTDAVRTAYDRGALPMISWEPWAGPDAGVNQPDFALAKISKGEFDAYLTEFATGVRDNRLPVAIRFAHEMNGHWYPWSERRSGNRKGDYVRAWRHIHDVFQRVGANNVIWVWSPNIIRPVPKVALKALYPGDDYVDWAGMVGYAVTERTAAAVFEPTIKKMRTFTDKPIVITETGAQHGAAKAAWIQNFFTWLGKRRDIAGFVWFEYSKEEGGSADWRFSHNQEYATAFKNGADRITLAPPITPEPPPSGAAASATPTP
ncbi:glycoside hydrolase family 26 protein [Catellatospora vulcania]|uniref:glycoside hydrolase family 26 protein n=1 Tax=Catellatospora vulcania TaxID=1460450 RepID=UPI0012D380D5|nr:glycosyl hydrolase [Catellatospora vulcania]